MLQVPQPSSCSSRPPPRRALRQLRPLRPALPGRLLGRTRLAARRAVARKPRRPGQAEQKRRAGTALQPPRTALQRARRLTAAAGVVCRGLRATSARAACGLRPTTRGRRAGPGPAWLRGRAWARQAWPGHCAACQAQSRESDAKSFEHFMSPSCTEMSLHRLPTCVRRLSVGRMC